MPFSCHVETGHVVLTPAPRQSYRIYGAADHQMFVACSPRRPDLCHSFAVHQFDLDCGGTRTSWLSVAEALLPWEPGRSFVSGGRMHVVAGPLWPEPRSERPCGPMPYGLAAGPWGYGIRAMPWPCAGGPPRIQHVIDLPSGFAPAPRGLAEFTLAVATAAADAPAGSASPAPAAASGKQGRDSPSPPSSPPANQPNSPSASPSQAANIASGAAPVAGDGHQRVQTIKANDYITGSIGTPRRTEQSAWIRVLFAELALGLAALGLATATLFYTRRRAREVLYAFDAAAGISTKAAGQRAAAAAQGAAPHEPSFERGEKTVEPDVPPARGPLENDWLPTTRSEAFEVLGALPETGMDVLKAVVKKLRQTWHPDHAKDEDDRRVRERRLKEINVAWDIVRGKRQARGRVAPSPAS